VVHHIIIQTTLFLAAGLIERQGGSTALDRLGGLARLAPVLAVLFFLPALNLAGIPPFSGFLGKLGLLQAGVADGGILAWLLVAGSVLTSLLTLYAIGRVWNIAFWSRPHAETPSTASVLPRLDRIVAVDVLLAIVVCAIAAEAAITQDATSLPILVVLSILGFIGSVSVASFAPRSRR
jgi:formate hydrogenlyase subunit 3/multisubunit Na+/H+ antiporter MnhD subunit